jgi:hypothetical protein
VLELIIDGWMQGRKLEESTTVGLNVMMNEWSIYSECVSYVSSEDGAVAVGGGGL